MLQEILLFCAIMSFVAVKSSFFPLKFAVGFAWFGVFVYWLTNPVAGIAAGSPTDVVIMLVFLLLGFIFVGMGFITRKGSMEVEEESSVGGLVKRIKYVAFKNNSSLTRIGETEEEYRKRVHHALTKSRPKRRR